MAMKQYATFELYLRDQRPKHQAIVRKLRAFVRRVAPQLTESVKWGNGCWLRDKEPIAYVYCAPDHVQFGFVMGAKLKDPGKRLHGEGAFVRHLKLLAPSDFDEVAFAALLLQAAQLTRPLAGATKTSKRTKSAAARRQ